MQCHGICHLKKQLQKTKGLEADSNNMYPRIDLINVLISKYQSGLLTTERRKKKQSTNIFFINNRAEKHGYHLLLSNLLLKVYSRKISRIKTQLNENQNEKIISNTC